jgi:hypothetical protein
MAYDEELAARVRTLLGDPSDVTERRMFGGLTFLVGGHMCCAESDELILRLGAEGARRRSPSKARKISPHGSVQRGADDEPPLGACRSEVMLSSQA